MSTVVLIQCDATENREKFNASVIANAKALENQDIKRITAYTTERDGKALHDMVAGKEPALINAAVVFAGNGSTAAAGSFCLAMAQYTVNSYDASVRRLKCYPDDAVIDGQTKGLFMVTPTRRKTALNHADFDQHWENNHTPIAIKQHTNGNTVRGHCAQNP